MPNDILKTIADNPALLKAVREVIEKQFSLEKVNNELPNELLGQALRARIDGLACVALAFKEIELSKSTTDTPPKKEHPGR